MLSRVADSLYWMSRYLERAENTVRLLDTNMSLMLDRSGTSNEGRWKRVLSSLGNPQGAKWNGDVREVLSALTFNASNRSSITACIAAARENARQVREEISTEQWQRLNRLYHYVNEPQSFLDVDSGLTDFFSTVLDGIHLFKGVTDTTMSHGEGWQFIRIGRYLERAHATATLLEVYHREILGVPEKDIGGHPYLEFVGLLRCCTAFEAYCQAYTADLLPDRILEFLLLNKQFPHSLRYSIDGVRDSLLAIQQEGVYPSPELNAVTGRLQASLSFITVTEVLEQGPESYLRSIREQCVRIHDLVYKFYIHYSVQTALAM
jgi:uncharacterized alpha-E superfamily protein